MRVRLRTGDPMLRVSGPCLYYVEMVFTIRGKRRVGFAPRRTVSEWAAAHKMELVPMGYGHRHEDREATESLATWGRLREKM